MDNLVPLIRLVSGVCNHHYHDLIHVKSYSSIVYTVGLIGDQQWTCTVYMYVHVAVYHAWSETLSCVVGCHPWKHHHL